jgi:hypothetical protein
MTHPDVSTASAADQAVGSVGVSSTDWRPGRAQTRLAISLILVMSLTFLGLVGLSHWQPMLRWMERREAAIWKTQNALYAYRTGYTDADNRLLLQTIYETDYSRPGVYFVGSSTMQFAAATWLLPAEEQSRLHNYSIMSANYKEQFQWIRYLVENRGLLKAGPGNTLVVLGLSHLDARPKRVGSVHWNYIPNLLARHGLYVYSAAEGISDALPAPLSWVQRERCRASEWLNAVRTHTQISARPYTTEAPPTQAEVAAAQEFIHNMMGGDDWSLNMDVQINELIRMITYLQDHGAQVHAVLLPLKSWNHGLKEADAFESRAKAACSAKSVPITDLSRLLPDDCFVDRTHLNSHGQAIVAPIFADLARQWQPSDKALP